MNVFTLASAVGFWSVSSTDSHVVSVDYDETASATERKPKTDLEREVDALLRRYFAGEIVNFSGIPVEYSGSSLTRTVMERLREIPRGQVYSYQWLAEELGMPKAARAIGNALGRNPVPIIVPCHRIVAKSGLLGGFMQGVDCGSRVKTFLLELEGHRFQGKRMLPCEPVHQPQFSC